MKGLLDSTHFEDGNTLPNMKMDLRKLSFEDVDGYDWLRIVCNDWLWYYPYTS
jgi:hypothetical protein